MFVFWSHLLHLLPSLPCHLQRRDWAYSEGTSTRLRLVFPSQSILVLTNIPLRTRWSAGSNSARVLDRGCDRRCVSSFVSGHATRAASMLIFSSFEVRARVHKATSISKRGFNTLKNIPLKKGTVSKRLDLCYYFGTFYTILYLYFLNKVNSHLQRPQKSFLFYLAKFMSVILSSVYKRKILKISKSG